MTAQQGFAISYALMVRDRGGVQQTEEALAKWSEEVKLAEMDLRAAQDPTWGDTEEAQDQLRDVFATFGSGQRKKDDG